MHVYIYMFALGVCLGLQVFEGMSQPGAKEVNQYMWRNAALTVM